MDGAGCQRGEQRGTVDVYKRQLYVSYLLPMMCEVQWWEFAA